MFPAPLLVDVKKYQIPIKIRTEALKKLLSECQEASQLTALQTEIMDKEKSIAMLSNKKTLYLSKIAAYLLELRKSIIPSLAEKSNILTEIVVLDEPDETQLQSYFLSATMMQQLDFPLMSQLESVARSTTTKSSQESNALDLAKPESGPELETGAESGSGSEETQAYHMAMAVSCDRCHIEFRPFQYYQLATPEPCKCHDGRLLWPSKTARAEKREKLYTCCSAPEGQPPCAHFTRHVYSIRRTEHIDRYIPSPYYEAHNMELPIRIIAIDCEMVMRAHVHVHVHARSHVPVSPFFLDLYAEWIGAGKIDSCRLA